MMFKLISFFLEAHTTVVKRREYDCCAMSFIVKEHIKMITILLSKRSLSINFYRLCYKGDEGNCGQNSAP